MSNFLQDFIPIWILSQCNGSEFFKGFDLNKGAIEIDNEMSVDGHNL